MFPPMCSAGFCQSIVGPNQLLAYLGHPYDDFYAETVRGDPRWAVEGSPGVGLIDPMPADIGRQSKKRARAVGGGVAGDGGCVDQTRAISFHSWRKVRVGARKALATGPAKNTIEIYGNHSASTRNIFLNSFLVGERTLSEASREQDRPNGPNGRCCRCAAEGSASPTPAAGEGAGSGDGAPKDPFRPLQIFNYSHVGEYGGGGGHIRQLVRSSLSAPLSNRYRILIQRNHPWEGARWVPIWVSESKRCTAVH